MCGILGLVSNQFEDKVLLNNLCGHLSHRGPDNSEIWSKDNVHLGHLRLSIQDLSEFGNQPMLSYSGRYCIVYNGECYNSDYLKQQIATKKILKWDSHSDTRVILEYFEVFGIEQTLKDIDGMFAIALYDTETHSLVLARDKFGEKPVYYGNIGDRWLFTSELKPILKTFKNDLSLDYEAVDYFLKYSNVPNPLSIIDGIKKLEPGHYIILNCDNVNSKIVPKMYWSVRDNSDQIKTDLTYNDAKHNLKSMLVSSVESRLISDVPIGAFLSGGYDSTLITSLVSKELNRKIDTFSIGFDDKQVNEAHFAKQTSKVLGTNHHELYVKDKELLDFVPNIAQYFSEPFADPSLIPTFFLCRLARQNVTVCLTGDAGDELFCGYNRYFHGVNNWRKFTALPLIVRKALKKSLVDLDKEAVDKIFSNFPFNRLSISKNKLLGDKISRFVSTIDASDVQQYYLRTMCKDPMGEVDNDQIFSSMFNSSMEFENDFHELMYYDTRFYLPDNNLHKVDICSMANSLETRVPFLNSDIYEFTWSLPSKFKYDKGQGKLILKDITHDYISKESMERPKMGFGVPLQKWLTGPLSEWAEELLDSFCNRAEFERYHAKTQKAWDLVTKSKGNHFLYIWNVLMFELWLKEYMEN